MNPGKVIDLQRAREARAHTKKPRTMFQEAVVKLAELDELISETKHPAGEFLMLMVMHSITTAFAVIKAPSSDPSTTQPTTRKE